MTLPESGGPQAGQEGLGRRQAGFPNIGLFLPTHSAVFGGSLDRNGELDFSTFLTIMHMQIKQEDPKKEILLAMLMADKEKKGYIMASELRSKLTKLGEKLTHKEGNGVVPPFPTAGERGGGGDTTWTAQTLRFMHAPEGCRDGEVGELWAGARGESWGSWGDGGRSPARQREGLGSPSWDLLGPHPEFKLSLWAFVQSSAALGALEPSYAEKDAGEPSGLR